MQASRVWLGAFACFLVLGATWAFASPLLSVPDEPAHLVKAAALARGELTGRKIPIADEGPGSIFRGGFTTVVHVPYSYTWQTSKIPNCFISVPTEPAGCAPEFRDLPRDSEWTTWVGQYPPTYYAAVGWTTLLDTGQLGFYLARLWSAALSAAFLASAFACAVVTTRHRYLALAVVLSATPMTLFLAGSVNPNGLEITTAVCFWAALGAIVTARDRPTPGPLYAAALVSGLVLAWTRPLSVLWLAIAAVVLVLGFGCVGETIARVGRRRTAWALGAFGAVSVLAFAWAFGLDALGNAEGDDPRGLGLVDALRHSAGRSGGYIRQMVGVFGWKSTPPPALLTWVWGAALVALVVVGLWAATTRIRIVLLGVGALALLTPIALEVPRAADHGFAWQGRYGLPVAAGVPVVAALALATGRELARRARRALTLGIVLVVAGGQVLAHAAAMRRYVTGSDGSWWYLSGHGWNPPLPAALLLLATITGAAGLAVLTYRVGTAEAPADDPSPRSEPAHATG
ncbi:MAG: DUF2142 domain-containing protein [Acidimicrobiia bacterium]